MDAAEPVTTNPSLPTRHPPARHGLLALASLAAGALLLHAGLLIHILTSGTTLHWHGSELEAQGAGKSASITASSSGLSISRPQDTRPLIVTAMKDPFREGFDAALYDRVIVDVRSSGSVPGVVLLWTREDQPQATQSQPLKRDAAGHFVTALAGHPRWNGRIIGLGLALTGDLGQPVTLSGVTLAPRERIGVGRMSPQVWKEWTTLEGWGWHSVNFVIGGAQGPILSPVLAAGIWVVLSTGFYLLLARRLRSGVHVTAVAGIFLAGWLVLDLRWQIDLWSQNRTTWQTFAGKTWADKRAAEWDGTLFEVIEDTKRRIGPEPQRLVILSNQEDESVGYLAYHALPHNALVTRPPNNIDGFRPGDYVLILAPAPGIDYRAFDRSLIWRGKHGMNTLPADPIHITPQRSALFRVRGS